MLPRKFDMFNKNTRFQQGTALFLVLVGGLFASKCATESTVNPGEEAENLIMTEVLRIGDETAGDTIYFGSLVWDIETDSRGRILVTDDSEPGFRVFTSEGALIHQVGSEGMAPGEFEKTPQVYVGEQDSVYAFDMENNRLTTFSADSYEFIRTTRLKSEDQIPITRPTEVLAVLPDRFVVLYEVIRPREPEAADNDGVFEVKLLDRSGEIVSDPLLQIPAYQATWIPEWSISMSRVFGRSGFVVWSSEGTIYSGWNENIHIRGVTPDGESVSEYSIPHFSVPVTRTEKQAESSRYGIEEWANHLSQDSPDTKPAFTAMVPDDIGRLWIQLSVPEDSTQSRWLIVEGLTGKVVAKTSLPANLELMHVRQEKAYGILDEEENMLTVWAIDSP